MTTLVTGATGFIGSRLVDYLVETGEPVRALVRPESAKSSAPARVLEQRDGVTVVSADLADASALARAMRGVDVVFHLAAQLPRRGVDPVELTRVNVEGTQAVLDAAAGAGARRLLLASSAMVYDPAASGQTEESPLHPHGDYGRSKVKAEARLTGHDGAIERVIARLAPVYGVGAPYFEWVISRALHHPRAVGAHAAGRVVQWIHVDDVAEFLVLAAVAPEAAGETFNVAGEEIVGLDEIGRLANREACGDGTARVPPRRRAQVARYETSKARRLLDYSPRVSLQEGVSEIVLSLMGDGGEEPAWGGAIARPRRGPWAGRPAAGQGPAASHDARRPGARRWASRGTPPRAWARGPAVGTRWGEQSQGAGAWGDGHAGAGMWNRVRDRPAVDPQEWRGRRWGSGAWPGRRSAPAGWGGRAPEAGWRRWDRPPGTGMEP